jgi:3-oxoacyl-[acyl-carrier protein] reductase
MMSRKLLEGKNAIVTGARRGIGRAVTEVFARNGANVWAFVRSHDDEFEEYADGLSSDCGVWVKPVSLEMTDADAMKSAIQAIMKEKQRIDVLVNNAGVILNMLYLMTTGKKLREQFDVNYFAPYIFTQSVAKLMIRNGGGSIINIASIAAMDGNSGQTAYGASKAAVIATTKSIASELGASGIRANCVAPGIVETDMLASASSEVVAASIDGSDLGKAAQPYDVANVCLFLASDMSSYVTGQTIRVDGGVR